MVYLTHKGVLNGERRGSILLDWTSNKLERVVRSPFEAELNGKVFTWDSGVRK